MSLWKNLWGCGNLITFCGSGGGLGCWFPAPLSNSSPPLPGLLVEYYNSSNPSRSKKKKRKKKNATSAVRYPSPTRLLSESSTPPPRSSGGIIGGALQGRGGKIIYTRSHEITRELTEWFFWNEKNAEQVGPA